jgi:hypothetical protein
MAQARNIYILQGSGRIYPADFDMDSLDKLWLRVSLWAGLLTWRNILKHQMNTYSDRVASINCTDGNAATLQWQGNAMEAPAYDE